METGAGVTQKGVAFFIQVCYSKEGVDQRFVYTAKSKNAPLNCGLDQIFSLHPVLAGICFLTNSAVDPDPDPVFTSPAVTHTTTLN